MLIISNQTLYKTIWDKQFECTKFQVISFYTAFHKHLLVMSHKTNPCSMSAPRRTSISALHVLAWLHAHMVSWTQRTQMQSHYQNAGEMPYSHLWQNFNKLDNIELFYDTYHTRWEMFAVYHSSHAPRICTKCKLMFLKGKKKTNKETTSGIKSFRKYPEVASKFIFEAKVSMQSYIFSHCS